MTRIYDAEFDALPTPADHVSSGGSFWRKEDPLLGDAHQILKGGMFDPQREWWELQQFIKVLVTGYGGGKSFILAKRMISSALLNAPAPVAIVCPNLPQAKLTTIPTIHSLLNGKQQLLRRAFSWSYHATPPITFRIHYRGRTGTIFILSAERPLSLKGGNLAAVAMEEPFIQPVEAFEQIVARVRHPDARLREIVIAGTPEQLNWGYELSVPGNDLYERYNATGGVGVVQASTMANRSLPDDYAERLLGGYDTKTADAFVYGQFRNLAEGNVYYCFSRQDHVTPLEPPSGARLGLGMDFNVDPMAAIMFWHTPDHIHYFREYEHPNADTEYAGSVAKEDFPEVEDVYPDASGSQRATAAKHGVSDFAILRQQGYTIRCKPANPARRDRYNATNARLKSRTGRVSVTVDSSCKRLIKYFEQYTHENMNKKGKSGGEAMSHLLDAATYPVAFLWPVVRSSLRSEKFTTGH